MDDMFTELLKAAGAGHEEIVTLMLWESKTCWVYDDSGQITGCIGKYCT